MEKKMRFVWAVLIAATVAAAFPVKADTVAGWEVTPAPEADGTCLARRNEAGKYLIVAYDKGPQNTVRVVLELGNTAWTFEPGAKLAAPLTIEPGASEDGARWQAMSAASLVTLFNDVDSAIGALKSAKNVGVRFPDGKAQDTTVNVAGFAEAMPLLDACRSKMP